MSLDIKHLTNGEITKYIVHNKGVTPPIREIYDTWNDIPKEIRDYAPMIEPTLCKPDIARILDVLDIFYPNHPNCIMPEYAYKKCIAESCKYKYVCEYGKTADWNN